MSQVRTRIKYAKNLISLSTLSLFICLKQHLDHMYQGQARCPGSNAVKSSLEMKTRPVKTGLFRLICADDG